MLPSGYHVALQPDWNQWYHYSPCPCSNWVEVCLWPHGIGYQVWPRVSKYPDIKFGLEIPALKAGRQNEPGSFLSVPPSLSKLQLLWASCGWDTVPVTCTSDYHAWPCLSATMDSVLAPQVLLRVYYVLERWNYCSNGRVFLYVASTFA